MHTRTSREFVLRMMNVVLEKDAQQQRCHRGAVDPAHGRLPRRGRSMSALTSMATVATVAAVTAISAVSAARTTAATTVPPIIT